MLSLKNIKIPPETLPIELGKGASFPVSFLGILSLATTKAHILMTGLSIPSAYLPGGGDTGKIEMYRTRGQG